MKISKSLFKNLTRCPNFASLYDMYTFRNMHHITSIEGELIKNYKDSIENLEEGIFSEQSEKAREIFESMYDEESGIDLTEVTSAQMEAMAEYFTKVELVAAEAIKKQYPGNLIYGDNIKLQKKFSYIDGEHEYYCYLDIYNECDDGTIRIFEVKSTTSKKFLELGKKIKELKEIEEANPLVRYPNKEKNISIFTKHNNEYVLKEELGEVIDLKEKDYLSLRSKLFERYSSNGSGKYVYDLAVERYIVENSLKKNKDETTINNMQFYLVVLNSDYELPYEVGKDEYIYPTDNNGNELIDFINLTKITKEYYDIIDEENKSVKDFIERRTIEKSTLSKSCEYKKTTECRFKNVCFKKALCDGSVLEFIDRTFKTEDGTESWDVYDLINSKINKIDEMPKELLTKQKHIVQHNCYTLNKEYLDTELVELAIEQIKYPIYHLDFESYNCPLPRYYKERPYMQSVFQFSLHVETEPGVCSKTENHLEYLAPDHKDHRREICEKMIEYMDLSNGGTVLVYNESFEKSRLKELAQIYPDLAPGLLKIRDSVFDLLFVLKGNKKMFMKLLPNSVDKKEKEARCAIFNYYNNGLHGSFSIKKVLPLFTNLSYKDLTVHNGTEAILTYGLLPTFTEEEYEKYYLALKQYCQQDTWAMVEILWGLKEYIKGK